MTSPEAPRSGDDQPAETSQEAYDAAAVVRAFAGYRDEIRVPKGRRSRRGQGRVTHPYTSDWNFRVHQAVLEATMPETGTILEAGPGGAANFTKLLARPGRRVIAGDISPAQLDALGAALRGHPAEESTTLMELDIASLPLDDGCVDAVAAVGGALSYVLDAGPRAVAEFHRVLRPEGMLVVSVMTPGWITSPAMGYREILSPARFDDVLASGDVTGGELDEADHRYRCYTTDSLTRLLEAGGFAVEETLASHIDGVPPETPLEEYLAACHHPRARDSTRAYLIAVARRTA